MLRQLEGQLGWLRFHSNHQCSGCMTFWCGSGSGGSGSADPCLWSCYIHHWPSRRQQKTNLKRSFSAYYLLKVHLHHFSKIKRHKEVKNQYYFCLMIEVSGSGSGSIPLTNGSGSGSKRPKNMWIRWFRIRIATLVTQATVNTKATGSYNVHDSSRTVCQAWHSLRFEHWEQLQYPQYLGYVTYQSKKYFHDMGRGMNMAVHG